MTTVLDNEAVRVVRIAAASAATGEDRPLAHGNAVLIGVRDGAGALRHRRGGAERYSPVARGRVDWLGPGEVPALAGSEPFGKALLVEVRGLPEAPGVSRTVGDKVLFRNDSVYVHEEILGPGQVRPMHSHAPRLIVPLTDAHAAQRFPGGETREDHHPAGGAHWAPRVMTNEVRNTGGAPFWAIVVEHA